MFTEKTRMMLKKRRERLATAYRIGARGPDQMDDAVVSKLFALDDAGRASVLSSSSTARW
jgi:hypothetical protein